MLVHSGRLMTKFALLSGSRPDAGAFWPFDDKICALEWDVFHYMAISLKY